jgi:hypothetical protein
MDAKFYAATQVIDEARHVEAYSRLLHDKFELVYPINPHLKRSSTNARDSRWDFTYLGMQVLIEGVALAAFAAIRDSRRTRSPPRSTPTSCRTRRATSAFGRLALRDYYPQLTEKERDEREEFAVEGCYLLRDRFLGRRGVGDARLILWTSAPGTWTSRPSCSSSASRSSAASCHDEGNRPLGPAHPQMLRADGRDGVPEHGR